MDSLYCIGYACDEVVRYKASSGGVGSAIIKYLLSCTEEYGTAMTFIFNEEKCRYEPRLVYSFEEYNICGSVYQDIDNIGFIRSNLDKIKKGIVVTCMPCQVNAIRKILGGKNIKNFIVSFCCSGQTIVEGTWCYYKFIGINKANVKNIQYRGNGWPSGIQITLDDGLIIKKNNWSYPWTIIQKSLLYRPKRCLYCSYKTVDCSDINLADPWLSEMENTERVGQSVMMVNTLKGYDMIQELMSNNFIHYRCINEEKFEESQKGTIQSKMLVKEHFLYYRFIERLSSSVVYRRIISSTPFLMKCHNFMITKMYKILK